MVAKPVLFLRSIKFDGLVTIPPVSYPKALWHISRYASLNFLGPSRHNSYRPFRFGFLLAMFQVGQFAGNYSYKFGLSIQKTIMIGGPEYF